MNREQRRLAPGRLLKKRPVIQHEEQEEQVFEDEEPQAPARRQPPPTAQEAAPWWHYQDAPPRRPIEDILGLTADSVGQVPQEDLTDYAPVHAPEPQSQPDYDYTAEPEQLSEEDEWQRAVQQRLAELRVTDPRNPEDARSYLPEQTEAPCTCPRHGTPAPRASQRSAPRPAPLQERRTAYPTTGRAANPTPTRGKFDAASFIMQDPDIAALATNDPNAPSSKNLPEDKLQRVARMVEHAQGRPAAPVARTERKDGQAAPAGFSVEDLVLDENLAGPQFDPPPDDSSSEAQ